MSKKQKIKSYDVAFKRPPKEVKSKGKEFLTPKNITISVIAFFLVVTLTVGLVMVLLKDDFDYMTSDLSDYIKLSEKDYKDLTVELSIYETTEEDVYRKIMNLRYKNRSKEPEEKGAEKYMVPIDVGHKVGVYYRGYTIDDEGNEVEIEGCSNLLGDIYYLEIGSLSFMNGFEESLVGAIPWNYQFNPESDIVKDGKVLSGDVIFLNYTAIYPDGTTVTKSGERIDLGADNLDEKYGEGFAEYFTADGGKAMGAKLSGTPQFNYGEGKVTYRDMTVVGAMRCDTAPLTIDVSFPFDYYETTLRGKSAKFDVYMKSSVIYNAPEYNESFITETLKITAEDLKDYEGANIVEKHLASLREEVKKEYEETRRGLIEEAMWKALNERVKVKKLPESKVNEIFSQSYGELVTQYQTYYSSYYASIDDFALAYYQLPYGTDWVAYLTAEAESLIKEKIIFYYIMREENLIPPSDVFETMYNDTVKEYHDYYIENVYDSELEALETDEEREERKAEIKEEMLEYYGEEYFKEAVYYEYALEKIVDIITVVEK